MARILLIDDDHLLRDTVAQMLEVDGHAVVDTADALHGLALHAHEPFDLVITDMLMPRTDGNEVILRLRERDPDLPIIAISGGRRVPSARSNLDQASHGGATRVLAKPFHSHELWRLVNDALASRAGGAR